MAKADDLFLHRKGLDEICAIPDRIISVYSLEKHVWADGNADPSRKGRRAEIQTIDEFRIDPVRPFLNDLFRHLAAPYSPERKEDPIGQGYWIQAEFGSGKSHLLCFLAALALGRKEPWELVQKKEDKAGRGKRDSLYRFWEDGLEAKSGRGKKGIFVVVKTLVGSGSGTVGLADRGRRLSEYVLDAIKEQLQTETGKNLSLYPTELLADRFLKEDVERYRADLKRFLRDPRFFEADEFEDATDFLRDIQQNRSPEYKRSCGNKLWRFYTEYLKVQPQIAAETEDILTHAAQTILDEGYAGLLLVLDEVSLFMKNRDDDQRVEDEKTLVVLANRLAKVRNLPVWTVCAAQQAIESKLGVKNIIADDRLKVVKLLEEDRDYYDIVLNRVRTIINPEAIAAYYLHYKRGFSWPNAIGEKEFADCFPFHKPALEVLRAITFELTTARSAIHFMHQTLKHQIKQKGRDLVRLWELFDEAVHYEEDPSGVHAGLVAIKTRQEADYRAYEAGRRQIDGLTKGSLKVHRDKAVKTLQTLFLYHVAKTRQQGITAEELANAVLIERDAEANVEENQQHYETLAENLKRELRQIAQSFDEDHRALYRFDPVFTGVDPRAEFKKARDEAEGNQVSQREAWDHLLGLDEWPIRTRQMTLDLSAGVRSIFRELSTGMGQRGVDRDLEVDWQGRQVTGQVGLRDPARLAGDQGRLPAIDTDQTDRDFACYVATRPVKPEQIARILERGRDQRVLLWSPGELRADERDRLLDFAAYRKLVNDWQNKETEDAAAVLKWAAEALRADLGRIYKIVPESYGRGRIDASNNSQMTPHVAGDLEGILKPLVARVLTAVYVSRDVQFEPPFLFRKEEGVKVINGVVKTGEVPKGKTNQNISAAQNFGFGLKIMKKSAERKLDFSDNSHVKDLWTFLDEKLADEGQSLKIDTVYKNFMGTGGPKDYGLSRRMVQIYLLCLVREGKVRVGLGAKSGLPFGHLDYANIAEVDFSASVLGSFTDVQKVARPENWEALRPYAEKLLCATIPSTHDDSVISDWRRKLKEHFKTEGPVALRAAEQARDLFAALQVANPYNKELGQAAALFAADLSSGDDISLILYALKEAYGHLAFDRNNADEREVGDLANRLADYRNLKGFLQYDRELRVAKDYCAHALPERPELKEARKAQRKLTERLAAPRPFIDSEVKLKAELIGRQPPAAGESGTLGRLVHEHATAYAALHDGVLSEVESARARVESARRGKTLQALRKLEGVTALQPAAAPALEAQLVALASGLFACSTPSRASVEDRLRSAPVHPCGLMFANAAGHVEAAGTTAAHAERLVREVMHRKLEIFLSPAVRQRLEQGRAEPVIAQLLGCGTVEELEAVLVPLVLSDEGVVELINRYLKRIVVKKVSLADFRPSCSTVEREQVPALLRELQAFLEQQLKSISEGGDSLPVLQIE